MVKQTLEDSGKKEKICSISELAELTAANKALGRKIVHCHGVFDLLHIGHIRYLKQAKAMGDVLVVTVTPDRFVDKGPHRPAFPETLRAEAIASLGSVDYTAINEWPTAEETLRLIRPDIYVKGSEFKNITSDMTGKIALEEAVVNEIGGEIRFTEDIVYSSTNLINRFLSNLPAEIQSFIHVFKDRHPLEELTAVIDRMKSLNVLVIGDTILDEYQYCNAIGKSSKDPVLAVNLQSEDRFAGGVLAVANHVSNFAGHVTLATVLGEKNSYEDFIRSKLNSNIDLHLAFQEGASTLIKRRIIDGYSFNKLLEIYIMDDSGLSPCRDDEWCRWLQKEAPKHDLVIAADFGHGAISRNAVKTLVESAGFLAVNTQANAGNRGHHTIGRYPRLNFACIAEPELRLEMRELRANHRTLLNPLGKRLGASRMVITRGRTGCVVWGDHGDAVEIPALSLNVVDRVGAGDAFFSVTSLAAFQDTSDEILGFIGNAVGGLAVEILGNEKSVEPLAVKKFLTSLMK